MKFLLLSLLSLFTSLSASAVCPVCTVGVGIGLGVSRYLGIDDLLVAIWMGAITVSLILWTKSWLAKKGIKSFFSNILNIVIYYAMTLSVFLLPDVKFGYHTLWGIDKILLGIIIGSIVMYGSAKLYEFLKKRNGGHAHFPYEKVAIPLILLITTTLIFDCVIGVG